MLSAASIRTQSPWDLHGELDQQISTFPQPKPFLKKKMLRGSSVKIEIKTELFSLKLREQRGKSGPMVLSGKSFTSFECSVDITELTVWDRCLSSWDPQLPLPSVPQLPALSALLLEIPNALMFFMHLEESCGAALPPTDRALARRTALPLSPLSWF